MKKLQFVKTHLKGWNKEVHGDNRERKKTILMEIATVDQQLCDGSQEEELIRSVELKK